ncbi:hypothetical protein [Flavobacterium piscis]|uniref:Cold-shock protein n=1 Tax=Flavobacterium piscis TaxID=1114874 RepID=A0ABU1YAH0_9FLAO|nr:hypothetical protein [Flavobacterium piscis]MDR7211068.1 hypothetical protein [Flavobacterium piscis]
MEKKSKNPIDLENPNSDKDFNARNQYSGSGTFSPDEEEGLYRKDSNLESETENNFADLTQDLQQENPEENEES